MEQQIQQLELLKENNQLCGFCQKAKATITVDTPKHKDCPLCDLCFKKLQVIAGVMKKETKPMHITEIWDKVKDVNNSNWQERCLE